VKCPVRVGQHVLLDAVAGLVDAGRLRTTLTARLTGFNAATLRAAHATVESGRVIGKVVVTRG
jgi:NADPH:quinone reductase